MAVIYMASYSLYENSCTFNELMDPFAHDAHVFYRVNLLANFMCECVLCRCIYNDAIYIGTVYCYGSIYYCNNF